MLRRIRELFNDVLRQADLLLLALCGEGRTALIFTAAGLVILGFRCR